jgi:hypothetical protein
MHKDPSIAWSFFFSPEMAPDGQIRAQAPQPLHFSVIV